MPFIMQNQSLKKLEVRSRERTAEPAPPSPNGDAF